MEQANTQDPADSTSAASRSVAMRRSSCNRCARPAPPISTRPSSRRISWRAPAPASSGSRSTTRRTSPALKEIRAQTKGVVLSVDLQENYKHRRQGRAARRQDSLQPRPSPSYREGARPIPQKVKWLVDVARDHDVAIRIGVNCGSVAPAFLEKYPGDQLKAIVESAAYHCELMDDFGFDRFVVSLKDSDPSQGDRGQSPLRRAPSRRAAASGRHRGRVCRPTASSRRASPSRSCSRSRSATPSASR